MKLSYKNPDKFSRTQKGSVLFYIFVGIVLFAALGFSVAQMMRGNESAELVSEEQAKIYAGEILDYTRGLRQTVQNLKISNGCDDLGISFENTVVSGYTHTPAADDKCKVFGSSGGGLPYMIPPDNWLDSTQSGNALYQEWYFPARVCINGIGTKDAGACHTDSIDNEEILVVLPYVKEEICIALNDKLGIDNPGGDPPAEGSGNAWPNADPKFQGTQTNNVRLNQDNQMNGCFEGNGASNPPAGSYHFFQVLIPR